MLCLSMCTSTYFPCQYFYVVVCMFMHVCQCMKAYVLSIYPPLYFLYGSNHVSTYVNRAIKMLLYLLGYMCASVFANIYICTYACHYVCGCRCLYVFDNVSMYAYAYIYLFMNVSGATSSWGHWTYRHICAHNICLDCV